MTKGDTAAGTTGTMTFRLAEGTGETGITCAWTGRTAGTMDASTLRTEGTATGTFRGGRGESTRGWKGRVEDLPTPSRRRWTSSEPSSWVAGPSPTSSRYRVVSSKEKFKDSSRGRASETGLARGAVPWWTVKAYREDVGANLDPRGIEEPTSPR